MLKMFEKDTKQKGYRYLLQKNARCPICAGTLRHYNLCDPNSGSIDILIHCINCKSNLKVVDFGIMDSELTVEVC